MTISEIIAIIFLVLMAAAIVLSAIGYPRLMRYKERQVDELEARVDKIDEWVANAEDKNNAGGSK